MDIRVEIFYLCKFQSKNLLDAILKKKLSYFFSFTNKKKQQMTLETFILFLREFA